MRVPDIVLVAPMLDVSGTAEAARNFYLALFDLGLKVKIAELPNWSHIKADLSPEVRDKIQIGFDRNDLQQPVAIHFYPPNPFTGPMQVGGVAFNVSFTVFETDKCPVLWRDILNGYFQENWVACPFNIDAYVSQGVDKNKLKCIPHGVDSRKYNPNVEPLNIKGKKDFTVLTALDWSVRKNPENMVTAFLQEFHNTPEACLVIKAYTGYADENSKKEIRSKISRLRMMTRSNATVLLITDFIHSDLMPSFHKAGNVWLNLSRGEGWDMGALQSMACGVPVIGSDNTAHQLYLNTDNGYPVPCTKTPISNKEFLSKSPQFLEHNWWEPNLKEARKLLRQSYNDWKSGELQKKSEKARATALNYPWKRTAVSAAYEIGKYFQ